MKKFVYSFLEANNVHCSLIGSKAESLAKINSMGLPVPPGFIITTEACKDYYENDQKISKEIKHQILDAILNLEKLTKKKFYRPKDKCYVQPLILSARSGAEVSMPGMMDTILNIGFTNEVIDYLIDETDEPKFVNDTYLRFLRMFLDVNAEILKNKIDSITGSFQDIVFKMKKLYEEKKGCPFPEDTHEQLFCAIDGVFRSWNNKRAKYYRQVNNIPEDGGTAVTVQMMVFGNFQENSGTGVAFSRNPISGEKHLFGEYLTNAQGEDVVAGTRTPSSIDYLKKKMPDVYNEFSNVSQNLEDYFIDIQDMEFTVEKGKLYLLQTRRAKRSPIAAIRTALDFLNRGKINIYQAINRVKPEQIQMLLHPHFDKLSLDNATVIAKGLPAAPGASVGKVIFSSKDAKLWKEKGENVILVRYETSAEDIEGMHIAEGILTSCGGMTSHAAVVARGMGKCCVSGCEEIKIGKNYFISRETKINEGDFISLDGSSGNVYVGKIKTVNEGFSEEIIQFLNLSDKCRKILVMANADSPEDVAQAISMGASGVGLCRTEHMFFANDRINLMREMILAPNSKGRRHALERLFEFQKQDFQKMFDVASGRPIVVRLLDPPLNEFLTDSKEDIEKISYDLNIETLVIQETFQKLKECNPM
ncbi:MAG: pyruvate, phosphate dikinase, partial [Firmicutes bacterium]|nr:pyruvate, phosphate dikinase [Bacillota bacterium]